MAKAWLRDSENFKVHIWNQTVTLRDKTSNWEGTQLHNTHTHTFHLVPSWQSTAVPPSRMLWVRGSLRRLVQISIKVLNDISESESQSYLTLQNPTDYNPWNSLGQNTGVGSLSFLQGIFPTQESNPGLPHCRWILYHLSHKGSPRILEWVAYPFSSGYSQPRNRTGVSCNAGRFFTNWAIREHGCL